MEGELPRHFAPRPSPVELRPRRAPPLPKPRPQSRHGPFSPHQLPRPPPRPRPAPSGPLRSPPRRPLQHGAWLPVVSDSNCPKTTGTPVTPHSGRPHSNQVAATELNMDSAYGRASFGRGPNRTAGSVPLPGKRTSPKVAGKLVGRPLPCAGRAEPKRRLASLVVQTEYITFMPLTAWESRYPHSWTYGMVHHNGTLRGLREARTPRHPVLSDRA